jgi:hypothetical protein
VEAGRRKHPAAASGRAEGSATVINAPWMKPAGQARDLSKTLLALRAPSL